MKMWRRIRAELNWHEFAAALYLNNEIADL